MDLLSTRAWQPKEFPEMVAELRYLARKVDRLPCKQDIMLEPTISTSKNARGKSKLLSLAIKVP